MDFYYNKNIIYNLLNNYNNEEIYPIYNLKPVINRELRKIKVDSTKYRSIIGSLLYLVIGTRPDIIYEVSKASRKSKEPTEEDLKNALKICKGFTFKNVHSLYIKLRCHNNNIKLFL